MQLVRTSGPCPCSPSYPAQVRSLRDQKPIRKLAAAAVGRLRTRSGYTYKPAAVHVYRQALRQGVLPRLGSKRWTAISQRSSKTLPRSSPPLASPSSIRNMILPLRVIYRRVLDRGQVALNRPSS